MSDETSDNFYLLATEHLEGPFATVEDARKADRGRGLHIAQTVQPPESDEHGISVVGLRLIEFKPGEGIDEHGEDT